MSLKSFISAYIECALWSSTDENGVPLDDTYGPEDIAPESLVEIERVCADFYNEHQVLWSAAHMRDEQAGHDFLLTRNGHGAGFWDRGLGDAGRILTELCKPYGEAFLYIGDDGKVYHD